MIIESTLKRKICPFCGYHRVLIVRAKDYDTTFYDESDEWFHCECERCSAQTQEKRSAEGAISVWNMREKE
jgi:Lar family restriction alleviation protein